MADAIDREAPRRRPEGPAAGHQRWRNLLFVHHRYPVDAVRALVPPELDLDTWDGDAWVGVVPFEMEDIRPWWVPERLALDFLETNLRTYVTYRGEPGVYFFSLEASSRLAVRAARIGWSLPYHHATMGTRTDEGLVSYTTIRRSDPKASLETRYRLGASLGTSTPGSLAFFLLERYYLFSMRRGRVHKGHVHHVPYPAFAAELDALDDGLFEAAGLHAPSERCAAVHFSPGVDVEVFGPWPVD